MAATARPHTVSLARRLFVVPRSAIQLALHAREFDVATAYNRVNALSAIKGAEHGWLGSCYSVAELLTLLHYKLQLPNVVLSKGHAAAMQYACLFGQGLLSTEMLLGYKKGVGYPDAHADLQMDTGSLGQCLSAVCGMALARPEEQFAVVMGDGELQEGQVYESLMSIRHRKLTNITVFCDLNGFQSDNLVTHVKPVHNLEQVLEGFGFKVLRVNGHDIHALEAAWSAAQGSCTVILCDTDKGAGSPLLHPSVDSTSRLLSQPWHTKVPQWPLYCSLVSGLLQSAVQNSTMGACPSRLGQPGQEQGQARPCVERGQGPARVLELWQQHQERLLPTDLLSKLPNKLTPPAGALGTGKAFGARVCAIVKQQAGGVTRAYPKVAVLDGDLAGSCGLNPISDGTHKAFIEMGVSEQDMVSCAGGLALSGVVPIVNTYGVFFKRAQENVFINLAEGTKVIYAGHYCGLCYHTDGKSHQSLNDASVMAAMPQLLVLDPVSPTHATALLDWALSSATNPRQSVYFRLRRTPFPHVAAAFDKAATAPHSPSPHTPVYIRRPAAGTGVPRGVFLVMGTVAAHLALRCVETLSDFHHWGIVVISALNAPPDALSKDAWSSTLRSAEVLVVLEDDTGSPLYSLTLHMSTLLRAQLGPGLRLPQVLSHSVSQYTWPAPSFRRLEDCLKFFSFTPMHVLRRVDTWKKVTATGDKQGAVRSAL